MRKYKYMAGASAELWIKAIKFLKRTGLLEEFKEEIKETKEFGFFMGMLEVVNDIA